MADFGKYYRAYMYMQEQLKTDFTYKYIEEALKDADKGDDSLVGRTSEKVIDMDWVVAIEETLPYIRKAIDEQRRFIKQVENVVRIEKAKKITPDSVKHLSQHTSYIAKVEGDMVTPNKILTVEREESFAIYENRVLMTLIHKALMFVDDKYSKMKDVPNDSYNNITVQRHLHLNQQNLDFSINYVNENQETLADDLDVVDVESLSDFDRIRRIRQGLNECLATKLMREIAKEPQVRPPITQTNLLKKNPNFKKAMELWTFLDSYKKTGFDIVGQEFSGKMTDDIKQDVYFSMGFQHFIMSITTNPALRKMLDEKYHEENARMEEEANRPEKTRAMVLQQRIDDIRKEEMEIRLKEIREREKKIHELTNEVKTLKNTIDQKEKQILTLKGQVSILQDELDKVKKELQDTKLQLLQAKREIERLTEENQYLRAQFDVLTARVTELEGQVEALNNVIHEQEIEIRVLTEETNSQKVKIKEQEEIIEKQTAQIKKYEADLLYYGEKLKETRAKLELSTAENEKKQETIVSLLDQCENLNEIIDAEREQHTENIKKLNEELDNKLNLAKEQLNADLEKFKAECDNSIANAKLENAEEIDKLNVQHNLELEKLEKSVQKRAEALGKTAEKNAEKRLQAEIKNIKRQSDEQIKQIERKAGEKIKQAKTDKHLLKSTDPMIQKDYPKGIAGLSTMLAQGYLANSNYNTKALLEKTMSAKAIYVSLTSKGVTITRYKFKHL